ncbi:MAG: OsmC family protein [Chloroflexi bacterium]|nr:OsmC family protein [Chloroflexota bacterium]
MSTSHIKESVDGVVEYYRENPDEAKGAGAPFKAIMEDGLRCRVEKLDGTEILKTDMAKGIGGGGSAPSPGTLFRAALVSCDATFVALRAAQLGIKLTTLEVTLEGDPDDDSTLGFLGIDDSIPAGERTLKLSFHLGAENATSEQLHELVEWIVAHSPVGDSVSRAIPITVDVKTV